MSFNLTKASVENKEVLKNLMQFYLYDFSEYTGYDVEGDGLFKAYPGLDDYWKEENHKFPYLIKIAEKYVGFVLVKFIESETRNYFSIAEFFIMKKYRKQGVGRVTAKKVFDLHKGQWEVHQMENNKPAQIFWKKIIDDYTKGQYTERLDNGRMIRNFEN